LQFANSLTFVSRALAPFFLQRNSPEAKNGKIPMGPLVLHEASGGAGTSEDFDLGSFRFIMGSGVGTPNGGTSGVDATLFGFVLGFSVPIFNIGDYPQPCVNTPELSGE